MHPVTYLFVGMSIVLFVVLVVEVVMSVRAWRVRRRLRMPPIVIPVARLRARRAALQRSIVNHRDGAA